jgi:hypothetical protein
VVQSYWIHEGTGALSREAGSRASRCVAACGSTSCPLSWLDASLRRYSIYRVPSVVFFSSNDKSSDVAKHIDIKYFVVTDRVQDQIVEIDHLSIN